MDKNPFSELPLAPEPTGAPAPMGNLDGLLARIGVPPGTPDAAMLGRFTFFVQATLFAFIGMLASLPTCGLAILPLMGASLLLPALAYVRLSGRTEPGLPDPVLD